MCSYSTCNFYSTTWQCSTWKATATLNTRLGIDIHKSQGMTLNEAWLDIVKKESTLGIAYVAISRVLRNISSLVIEPMTFERLQKIRNSELLLKYRLKEEQRLKQLSAKRVLSYSKIVWYDQNAVTLIIIHCSHHLSSHWLKAYS